MAAMAESCELGDVWASLYAEEITGHLEHPWFAVGLAQVPTLMKGHCKLNFSGPVCVVLHRVQIPAMISPVQNKTVCATCMSVCILLCTVDDEAKKATVW